MRSGLILFLLASLQLNVVSSRLVPVVNIKNVGFGPVVAAGSFLFVPCLKNDSKKNQKGLCHSRKGTVTTLSVKGDNTNNKSGLPSEEDETAAVTKARDTVRACAKITFLSAALDLVLDGTKCFQEYQAGSNWLFTPSLLILWKLILSYNLRSVSNLYETFEQEAVSSSSTTTNFASLGHVLDTMTRVWRSSAIMITTLAVIDISKASVLINSATFAAIIIGAATIAFYTSEKETKQLTIIDNGADSNNSKKEMARIARKGRTTVRAMLLCATSLLLRASVIPFTASRMFLDTASYRGIFVALLDLPTPVATAGFLRQLRKAILNGLSDLIQSNEGATPATTAVAKNSNLYSSLGLQPQTRINLAKAQQSFYGKVKGTITLEVIVKLVTAIFSSKAVSSMIASLMGKS